MSPPWMSVFMGRVLWSASRRSLLDGGPLDREELLEVDGGQARALAVAR
jgi:hypothetical protein